MITITISIQNTHTCIQTLKYPPREREREREEYGEMERIQLKHKVIINEHANTLKPAQWSTKYTKREMRMRE